MRDHTRAQTLAVGQSIACAAGRYTVVVYRLELAYRVEVHHGVSSQCVAELTRSYRSGPLACAIARVITVALRVSDGDIDAARHAVVNHLDGELLFLLADPSPAAANAAAELQAIKAGFELGDEQRRADLVARIRATMTAAGTLAVAS